MPAFPAQSHIAKLPNELLLEIFRLRSSPNDIPLPIRVSQVCRHWRRLSLNSSLIWSQIDLSWHPLGMIKTCIERARSNPLDIHIVLDDYTTPRCHSIKEGLNLIIPEIHRWRSLTVDAQYFGSMMTVFTAIRHQYAPQLKSITMTLDDTLGLAGLWHQSENSYFGILGGGAPRLTSLELCGVSLHYCHPPLESLKRLSLSAPCDSEAGLPLSYAKLQDVLHAASGLEELSLQGRVVCHQESRSREPLESVEVPHLSHLQISAPGGESAEDQCQYILSVCRILQAPRLTTLATGFLGRLDGPQRHLDFSVAPVKQQQQQQEARSSLFSTVSDSASRVPYASLLLSHDPMASSHPLYEVDASEASFEALSESANPLLARISTSLEMELSSLSRLLISDVDGVRLKGVLDVLSKLSSGAEREDRSWRALKELTICSSARK